MKSTTGLYLSKVDHLRFLAALMVICWHFGGALFASSTFWPLSLLGEGHTGVSLFLVISGFIFTVICGDKEISYSRFLQNRLLRVGPLAILWTLFFFFGDPSAGSSSELFASLFGLLNRGAVPNVGWTIIVEFQFYVVFPFLLLFAEKYGVRYLWLVMAAFFLFRVMHYATSGSVQSLAYSYIFGRMDQFLLGMIGGFAYLHNRTRLTRWWLPTLAVGIAGISSYMYFFHAKGGFYGFGGKSPSPSPIWTIQMTVEGAFYAAVLLGWVASPFKLPKVIDRFLAWLGSISYSMYWSHSTVIISLTVALTALGTGAPRTIPLFIAVYLPSIVAFSALTYYCIEKPFLRLRVDYVQEPSREAGDGFASQTSRQ